MSALQVVEAGPVSTDALVGWLESVQTGLAAAVPVDADDAEVSCADRIDRIAVLERLRSNVAALQAAECVKFARAQVDEHLASDMVRRDVGKGIAEQIGLACRLSPTAGAWRLSTARALWVDLPGTFGLLVEGRISETVAKAVVAETTHLDGAGRGEVDRKVVEAGIDGMGVRSALFCARTCAYETDPALYVARGRKARQDRRVSLRPAPDTMAELSGFLPVEQGVQCLAALIKHTDTVKAAGDERTRGQIMADTLVERLTGQAQAGEVPIEVELVIPLTALTDPDDPAAATIPGHGPLPGPLARELVAGSAGRRRWRRLFTGPAGEVVDGDRRSRRWMGWMTKLVRLRDQTCRDPFCDAPIRHLDHTTRWADGGPTTAANARGVCARGNHVRELPGWHVTPGRKATAACGSSPAREATPTTITTPTGHRYTVGRHYTVGKGSTARRPDPP